MGLTAPHAVGYYVPPFSDVPVREPVVDLLATAPAGGLASTVADLTTWGSFLADPDDAVLSPDTLEEMVQPQIMADLDGWRLAWGLGFMLFRSGDRVFIGHDGGMPGHITERGRAPTDENGGDRADELDLFPCTVGLRHRTGRPRDRARRRRARPVDSGRGRSRTSWWACSGRGSARARRSRSPYAGRPSRAGSTPAPKSRPPSVFTKIGDDVYRTASGRETGGAPARHPRRERPRHQAQLGDLLVHPRALRLRRVALTAGRLRATRRY